MKIRCLFLVILLIPLVNGALFDSWVTEKSSITLDGVNHSIRLNSDKDGLYISSLGVMIDNGSCKSTVDYDICFNGTRFDLGEGYGAMDRVTDKELHQAKVKVERVVHYLTVERSISTRYLALGGVETVHVKLKPSELVKDVVYIDELPSGLKLLNGLGVEILNQTVKAEFRTLDKDVTFSYNVKLVEKQDVLVDSAKITYSHNRTDKTLLLDGLNVIYSIKVDNVDETENVTEEISEPEINTDNLITGEVVKEGLNLKKWVTTVSILALIAVVTYVVVLRKKHNKAE